MMINYELKWKNATIATFQIDNESRIADIKNYKILDDAPTFFKQITGFNSNHIFNSLTNRSVIKNLSSRKTIEEEDIDLYDLRTLIDLSNLASLSDCLWVNNLQKPKTWNEVSLYKKPLQSLKKRIFVDLKENILSSLTTNGNLAKYWFWDSKIENWILVKKKERVAELLTSRLGEYLGIDIVHYDYRFKKTKIIENGEKFTMEIGESLCPNFANEEKSLLPMFWIIDETMTRNATKRDDLLVQWCSKEAYDDLCVFDVLTDNSDRHLSNIGLIVNNDTLNYEMTPYYDQGWSFKFISTDWSSTWKEDNYKNALLFGSNFFKQSYADLLLKKLQSRHLIWLKKIEELNGWREILTKKEYEMINKYHPEFLEASLKYLKSSVKIAKILYSQKLKRSDSKSVQ